MVSAPVHALHFSTERKREQLLFQSCALYFNSKDVSPSKAKANSSSTGHPNENSHQFPITYAVGLLNQSFSSSLPPPSLRPS